MRLSSAIGGLGSLIVVLFGHILFNFGQTFIELGYITGTCIHTMYIGKDERGRGQSK